MSSKGVKRTTSGKAGAVATREQAKKPSAVVVRRTAVKVSKIGRREAEQPSPKAQRPSRRATEPNRKAKQPSGAVKSAAATDALLFHHMHGLLHTMQTIQEHEEQLCSMTNEIRKSGRISPALRRDLRSLLEQLPAREYQNGIDQIYDELEAA